MSGININDIKLDLDSFYGRPKQKDLNNSIHNLEQKIDIQIGLSLVTISLIKKLLKIYKRKGMKI